MRTRDEERDVRRGGGCEKNKISCSFENLAAL